MWTSQSQSFAIHETKTDRGARRTRLIHSYSWRFQHPSPPTMNLGRRHEIWKTQKTGCNRHTEQPTKLQNRIHIFTPSSLGSFTKINLILGRKIRLTKYKSTKVVSSVCSIWVYCDYRTIMVSNWNLIVERQQENLYTCRK